MARVSSQKTRQAVLVTGDPVDADELPEKIQLFNELGEPLMIGGGYTRRSQSVSTAVLAPAVLETMGLEFFPSIKLYKISTNRPARIRIYPTEAQRNADLARGVGVKPSGNHGRLLEVVTVAGLLELDLSPEVDMTSSDPFSSTFYASITNLDSGSGSVVVNYYYFRTE